MCLLRRLFFSIYWLVFSFISHETKKISVWEAEIWMFGVFCHRRIILAVKQNVKYCVKNVFFFKSSVFLITTCVLMGRRMRPCWFQLRKVKKNIWTFGWSWLYSNMLLIWWRVIFLFTSTDMIYWNCTLLGSVPPHPRFTAFKVEILQSAAGCCQPIRVQSGHRTSSRQKLTLHNMFHVMSFNI